MLSFLQYFYIFLDFYYFVVLSLFLFIFFFYIYCPDCIYFNFICFRFSLFFVYLQKIWQPKAIYLLCCIFISTFVFLLLLSNLYFTVNSNSFAKSKHLYVVVVVVASSSSISSHFDSEESIVL